MRVKPSAAGALLVFVGYLAVVFGVWSLVGVDYDTVSDTVENVREGIVLAIGLAAAYMAVVTTALGWWRPAIHEPRKAGGGWMWAVPALLLIGAGLNLATTAWGDIPDAAQYVGWLALGTVLVGFSEEMLTRGVIIVGARGSMHERWAWVFSSSLFALLHVPNALFGQSGKDTAQQVVFAFLVGMTYYVTRRVTGTLVVTMVLHFLWDFSLMAHTRSTDAISAGPPALYVAVVVGIVALVKILKDGDVAAPGTDPLDAFSDSAAGPERTVQA